MEEVCHLIAPLRQHEALAAFDSCRVSLVRRGHEEAAWLLLADRDAEGAVKRLRLTDDLRRVLLDQAAELFGRLTSLARFQ